MLYAFIHFFLLVVAAGASADRLQQKKEKKINDFMFFFSAIKVLFGKVIFLFMADYLKLLSCFRDEDYS